MDYGNLGSTNIKISKLGYGTRLWDKFDDESEKKFKNLLDIAIQNGINLFVGAGHYSNGASEKMLGSMLEPYRNNILLATSSGVIHTDNETRVDLSVSQIQKQFNQSLKDLQTDYIDLFQLHYYDPRMNIKLVSEYLEELYESGIIRSFGVSNFSLQVLKDWEGMRIDFAQIPYNPLQREIEHDYKSYCLENNISLLGYTPFSSGILTEKSFISRNLYPYGEFLSQDKATVIMDFLDDCHNLAKELEITISELVLKWLKNRHFISSILFGTNNINHLRDNIQMLNTSISNSEIKRIDEVFDSFWNNFHNGITIPFTINKEITILQGKRYINFFGNLLPIPDSIKVGDTIEINDALGEIIC